MIFFFKAISVEIVFDDHFLLIELSFFIIFNISFFKSTALVICNMAMFVEVLDNWVTRTVTNRRRMVVDLE